MSGANASQWPATAPMPLTRLPGNPRIGGPPE